MRPIQDYPTTELVAFLSAKDFESLQLGSKAEQLGSAWPRRRVRDAREPLALYLEELLFSAPSDDGFDRSVFTLLSQDGTLAVQRELRSYLKEWIDSGNQANGTEMPYERKFEPVSCREPWNFADGNPNVAPPPRVLLSIAKLWGGTLLQSFDGYAITGCKSANIDGVAVSVNPQGGFYYEPPIALDSGLSTDPEIIAAILFVGFYRSAWIHQLMRCHGPECGKFEVLKRAPRKTYERGWHCKDCSAGASARALGEIYRKNHRRAWLKPAVLAFLEKDRKPKSVDLSVWITKRVNENLKPVAWIQRNTITHNLEVIKRKAIELRTVSADRWSDSKYWD
jgi:hypothetical protein